MMFLFGPILTYFKLLVESSKVEDQMSFNFTTPFAIDVLISLPTISSVLSLPCLSPIDRDSGKSHQRVCLIMMLWLFETLNDNFIVFLDKSKVKIWKIQD